MFRCVLAAAVAVATLPAAAQAPRLFPATALRGSLVVVAPPQVQLNGKPARLSAGARIRGESNRLDLSGSLIGQTLVVNYTVDGFGELKDVWILTPAERARQPWPTNEREAQAWTFDPVHQTWTKR